MKIINYLVLQKTFGTNLGFVVYNSNIYKSYVLFYTPKNVTTVVRKYCSYKNYEKYSNCFFYIF